jgi:hypothetical protein
MIGRICRVFKGADPDRYLNLTAEQLNSWYLEAIRQEAQQVLLTVRVLIASKNKDVYKKLHEQFHLLADPIDPEADGDMDGESIGRLAKVLGM